MTGARLFFVGGLFSYRALFNWISPLMYTTTMLGSPLFQLLFFTYLGRSYDAARGDLFYVVGNSIQVCAMSAIYAGTMTVANERQFGTLSALLGSPANRFLLFFGRTLPVIVNGLFVSAFAFLVGIVVIGVRFPAGSAGPLAVVLVVTVSSCTAMGMTLGSFGLRYRDVFFFSNLVYFLMLLLCGVNIPLSALPAWMQHICRRDAPDPRHRGRPRDRARSIAGLRLRPRLARGCGRHGVRGAGIRAVPAVRV